MRHEIIKKAKFESQAINIANGVETNINDISQEFCSIVRKSNIEIKFNNILQEGYPSNWQADISLLKKLGYTPDYNLNKGLTEYIDWLKKI